MRLLLKDISLAVYASLKLSVHVLISAKRPGDDDVNECNIREKGRRSYV